MGDNLRCPHCKKSLGGPAVEPGATRLRLGIVVLEKDGTVHGPCPACKGDVIVASGATLSKALAPEPKVVIRPGIRIPKRSA